MKQLDSGLTCDRKEVLDRIGRGRCSGYSHGGDNRSDACSKLHDVDSERSAKLVWWLEMAKINACEVLRSRLRLYLYLALQLFRIVSELR